MLLARSTAFERNASDSTDPERVISLLVELALTPSSADLNCSSALNLALTAFSRSALLRTEAVVPLSSGALLAESPDLLQAIAATANRNTIPRSDCWVMKN